MAGAILRIRLRALGANGEDVATVEYLLQHANVSVTMNTYV